MWFNCGSIVVQMWFICGSFEVRLWLFCGSFVAKKHSFDLFYCNYLLCMRIIVVLCGSLWFTGVCCGHCGSIMFYLLVSVTRLSHSTFLYQICIFAYCHRDFNRMWQNCFKPFKREKNSDQYADQLLNCVRVFNSAHLE